LIAAGGVFLFSRNMTVLSVRNLDRAASFHFEISPSEEVTLFHTNSIYGAPVEEVLEVRNGDLVLKTVRTDSPAVMEYYGFEGAGPVQTMNRSLGSAFSIKASMRQDQGFRIGQNTLQLRTIAGAGDRILVSVDQVSLARFLWEKWFEDDKVNPSTKH